MAPPVILLLIATQREELQTQPGQDKLHAYKPKQCKNGRPTFVFSMDIVADVQVQMFDLQVMRGLAYVIGTEQPGHGCTGIRSRGCLLGSYLLR